MLGLTEARTQILEAVRPLAPRRVPVGDALGLVLAEDHLALRPWPPGPTSAVDGVAVRSSDVVGATESNPIHVRLAESGAELPAQGAAGLTAGAPLPAGADAVVILADTAPHHEGYLAILEGVEPGQNVRPAGDTLARGSVALRQGTVLGPAHLAWVAELGIDTLPVHPAPQVGVLTAGRPAPRPVGVLLAGLLRRAGAEPVRLGTGQGTAVGLEEDLTAAWATCDGVVISGAIEAIPAAVAAATGLEQIHEEELAVQPPVSVVVAARDGKWVLGVAEDPVGAALAFWLLGRPAVAQLRGLSGQQPARIEAELAADVVSRRARPHYEWVRLERVGHAVRAHPLGDKETGRVSLAALGEADGLVAVPECRTVTAGTRVWVEGMD
ncbi:hypothetical protein HQ590_11390 [bacterium]|nr:hypothetical protein [bacterium]